MARSRPNHWPPAAYDQWLPQRLRDIGAQLEALPTSDGVRHHYVPQFLMRQFATPDDGKHIIRLSKKTGRYERVPIRLANQSERLYGAPTEGGDYDNRVEGFLQIVETSAAPAIALLCSGDKTLTEDVIIPISMLLGLQQMRSPTALDAIGDLIESSGHDEFAAVVSDPVAFARLVSLGRGTAVSPAEIESDRQMLAQSIRQGGGLRLAGKRNAGLETMVTCCIEAGFAVAEAEWHLLHSEDAEFVLNDVGYARFDRSHGLPAKEGLIFPLAARVCLVVVPLTAEHPQLVRLTCSARNVEIINQRLYAWAEEHILGTRQHTVTTVRAQARRSPKRARPPTTKDRTPGGPAEKRELVDLTPLPTARSIFDYPRGDS